MATNTLFSIWKSASLVVSSTVVIINVDDEGVEVSPPNGTDEEDETFGLSLFFEVRICRLFRFDKYAFQNKLRKLLYKTRYWSGTRVKFLER